MSERTDLILRVLKAGGRLDTHEIAAATGVPRPGSTLHYLLIDRKVRRVGERPSPLGRRPTVLWEAVDG